MPSRLRPTLRSSIVLAVAVTLAAAVAPAIGADQGSVEIVAIAPAFCRVTTPPPPLGSPNESAVFATARRACNTVNDAQITAKVSNLDGATLRLGPTDVAVSADGAATFSPEQLAALSDLHIVNARRTDARAPVAVELTITPQ
jgi:hypothetical protein